MRDEERSARLERLICLAEAIRTGAPNSRCTLATEHNGDPRELLNLKAVLVW